MHARNCAMRCYSTISDCSGANQLHACFATKSRSSQPRTQRQRQIISECRGQTVAVGGLPTPKSIVNLSAVHARIGIIHCSVVIAHNRCCHITSSSMRTYAETMSSPWEAPSKMAVLCRTIFANDQVQREINKSMAFH